MPDAQWHPQPRDTHHSQRGARMSEARCGTSETPDLAEPVIGGRSRADALAHPGYASRNVL
jgi:hypothetical protein